MNDILIVDDEEDIRTLISAILEDQGYVPRVAADSQTCLKEVHRAPPDLILLDIWFKGESRDGIDILRHITQDYPDIPIVMISGHGNIEIAVTAIKQGAYDFIEKPFNIEQLNVVVARALETAHLRRENAKMRNDDYPEIRMIEEGILFKGMQKQLDKIALSNGRVILQGEPGTGREIIARYLHKHSLRVLAPFIHVALPALADEATNRKQEQTSEHILFGRNEKGNQHKTNGAFNAAKGGILYINDIAHLSASGQQYLLRALLEDSKRSWPSVHKMQADNVRLIVATRFDLAERAAKGMFHSDLHYRLSTVPVQVPTLAQQNQDIPAIAKAFIERAHRIQNLPYRPISEQACAFLQAAVWPGHIRQLRNLLERVLITGDENTPISSDELAHNHHTPNAQDISAVLPTNFLALPLREARQAFEQAYLKGQIRRFGNNISHTADFIEMERSALHRKMKSLNINTDKLKER